MLYKLCTTKLKPPKVALAIEINTQVKWKKQLQGCLKCNSDGAWPRTGSRCGAGWVLRDQEGNIKWIGAKVIPKVKTVLEVEVEALR